MLEFVEADPLPIQCLRCLEQYCDECDYLGLRRLLTEESQQRLSQIKAQKKRLWELKHRRRRRGT